MIRGKRIMGKCVFLVLMLFVILQLGCQKEVPEEVPITTNSTEARALFIEGRQFLEFGHVEKAENLFDQAIAEDPDFALGWLFKSFVTAETGDFKANLEKAVSLAPNASDGEQKLIAAAHAFYEENDRVKANTLYEELAALYPNDVRVHWYLGRSYNGRNMRDQAMASWEKGLAIDEEFAPIHENLGYFYRYDEDYAKAEESFQTYLRLAPEEPNAHDCMADLYRKMGEFENALEHYRKAVELDTSFEPSHYKAATTLIFLDRNEEARQALRKLMEIRAEPSSQVYDMQGISRSYIFEGDYAGALETGDAIIQMGQELGLPQTASFAHLVQGVLHCELEDYEAAEASLDAGIDFLEASDLMAYYKNNQIATAVFWKAWVAKERQDFESALALAEEYKAMLEDIGNPAIMKNHTWLLASIALAQGDHARALELFGQEEIDWVFMMYYHGLAKEAAGDMEGAEELYKKVANWNLDGIWYSFVRKKAIDKL